MLKPGEVCDLYYLYIEPRSESGLARIAAMRMGAHQNPTV